MTAHQGVRISLAHSVFGEQFFSPFRTSGSLSASDDYPIHPPCSPHIYAHGQMVCLPDVWIVRWPESGPRSRKPKFCRSTKLLDVFDFPPKFLWRRWSLDISLLCSPSGCTSVLQQNRCLQKTVTITLSHRLAGCQVKTSLLISMNKTGQWNCQALFCPTFLILSCPPTSPALLSFTFRKRGHVCDLLKEAATPLPKSCP